MGEKEKAQDAITVGVRMRPLVGHEQGQKHCFKISNNEVNIIASALDAKDVKEDKWRFDHSMDSSDPSSPSFVSNAGCYAKIGKSIIEHALEGYNACLFCYGQTGTGKTTTILGDKRSGPGLLILLLQDLFLEVKAEEDRGGSLTVNVQMFEVYNEKVFDLLALKGGTQNIQMHVLPSGVQMQGAETTPVTTVDEIMRLIDKGNSVKHIAATAMNPQSSRGHTVFKLNIVKEEDDVHLSSEVYFADLAGHENEKTTKVQGDRLVELSFINKSLMWLQSAIHNLSAGSQGHGHGRKSHVSAVSLFRNSKLTLLLANALTGNSLINVIVTISPAAAHFPTSYSSLKFANEVKHMAVQVHSSAHTDPASMVKKLTAEVEKLKAELAIEKESNPHRRTTLISKELDAARLEVNELKVQSEGYHKEVIFLQSQLGNAAAVPALSGSADTSRRRASSSHSQASQASTRSAGLNGRNLSAPSTPNRPSHRRSSAEMTASEQKRIADENDKLKEEFQSLQRCTDTMGQENKTLRNELGMMRTNFLDVHRELEERQQREQRLVCQLEEIKQRERRLVLQLEETQQREQRLVCQQKASLNGSAGATAGDNVVFGSDVARSLAAITAKMNELQHDLTSNALDMEHDDIAALLNRAQQMVPSDILLESMDSTSRMSRGRTPNPRTDTSFPSTQMLSPEYMIPSPQRNRIPQARTPRGGSPQRQISAPIMRPAMQPVSPTPPVGYFPHVPAGFGVMSPGVVRPPLSPAPFQVQSLPQTATLAHQLLLNDPSFNVIA